MITFETIEGRFTYRVAGIAILDGHVLLHKMHNTPGEAYWVLPGGRAEIMEEARATLQREMLEETGREVEVGRLVWVMENFFVEHGTRFHEIGLYFEMFPWLNSLTSDQMSFAGFEGAEELEFRWHPLRGLQNLAIQPEFLADRLVDLPPATEHIVRAGV